MWVGAVTHYRYTEGKLKQTERKMCMLINEAIQFFRKQAGWTQKELAEKMMVSEKAISAYETGTRGISTELLNEFSRAFNRELKDFFDTNKLADEKEIFDSNGTIMWVTFVSSWDDGYADIETEAKYDSEKNVVYDIKVADTSHMHLDILDREYIILPDGSEKDVVLEDDWDYYKEELKRKEKVKAIY